MRFIWEESENSENSSLSLGPELPLQDMLSSRSVNAMTSYLACFPLRGEHSRRKVLATEGQVILW